MDNRPTGDGSIREASCDFRIIVNKSKKENGKIEKFSRELKSIQKSQVKIPVLKYIIETKEQIDKLNRILDTEGDRLVKWEGRPVENIQTEIQRGKRRIGKQKRVCKRHTTKDLCLNRIKTHVKNRKSGVNVFKVLLLSWKWWK